MKDKASGGLWRVHATFDLPAERFSDFDRTDEKTGEQLDRAAVVAGEIRIADRYYLQPDRIANMAEKQGDIIIRARWNAVRGCDAAGKKITLTDLLVAQPTRDCRDQPIWIARDHGARAAGFASDCTSPLGGRPLARMGGGPGPAF